MRAVGLSDLDLAARVLLMQPQERWRAVVRHMLEAAHTADVWRKRTGRRHPEGGTGSLFVQASLMPRSRAGRSDPRYISALLSVLEGLADWRARGERGDEQCP